MTPTQADYEAAARKIARKLHDDFLAPCPHDERGPKETRVRDRESCHWCSRVALTFAAALSEAVRVAPAHSDDSGRESDATKHAKDCLCACHKTDSAHTFNVGCQRALMEEAVRVAVEGERADAIDASCAASSTGFENGVAFERERVEGIVRRFQMAGDAWTDKVLDSIRRNLLAAIRSDAQATPAPALNLSKRRKVQPMGDCCDPTLDDE